MIISSFFSLQRLQKRKSVNSPQNAYIHYDKHVTASATKYIILLHGLGGSLTSWTPIRTILHKAGYSTIAVDLRGCGKSQKEERLEFYDFPFFVQDILNIIKNEHIKELVLVGHCFGGMIALNLEAAFPKTSSALILINTSYKPPSFMNLLVEHSQLRRLYSLIIKYLPNVSIGSYADFRKYIGSSDINIKRFFSDLLHTSVKSYTRILEKIMTYNGSGYLRKIKIPTLILAGTNDIIFPLSIAKTLHKKIKGSILTLIENGNHIMVINQPKQLAEDIISFIKKIDF